MFVLAYQLRMLIEATLLIDLGFTDDEVAGIFDRVRRDVQLENFRRAADEGRAAGEPRQLTEPPSELDESDGSSVDTG